jgi:multisubunit Na+/H+ antiporter MnhF subunit
MWHNPSRGVVIKFGLALAGALLSKFSSGLLFFVFPAFALSLRLMPLAEQPSGNCELRLWRRRAWINIAKGTLWAALFVYAVYLVLSWRQSTDSFSVIPHFPASPAFRRMLMPAWLYLQGVAGFALTALSRPTYILGRVYPHGVWFYFPVLFLLKSQLAFLMLLALTLIAAISIRFRLGKKSLMVRSGMEMHWRGIWVSLIVFVAVCLISQLDISIRHFMIALALIVLLLAPLPRMLRTLTRPYSPVRVTATALITAMCVAMVVTAIRAYPNYVPFVNSLGMGHPVHELVNDSNVDWNQSLPEAEVFARRHELRQLLLDEYGFSDPSPYVPQAQPWDCQQPAASDAGQWAVLSANFLGESGACTWLLQYPHEVLAGGSLYAVHLPRAIPPAGQTGGPPLPQNYRNFGGAPFDVRPIFQRCIRDPRQLEPTMDWIKSSMAPEGRRK